MLLNAGQTLATFVLRVKAHDFTAEKTNRISLQLLSAVTTLLLIVLTYQSLKVTWQLGQAKRSTRYQQIHRCRDLG